MKKAELESTIRGLRRDLDVAYKMIGKQACELNKAAVNSSRMRREVQMVTDRINAAGR